MPMSAYIDSNKTGDQVAPVLVRLAIEVLQDIVLKTFLKTPPAR